MKYEIKENSFVVKPVGEAIFSEQATFISIDNEGSGCYIVIKQIRDDSPNLSDTIKLDFEEWPYIDDAIKRLKKLWENNNDI